MFTLTTQVFLFSSLVSCVVIIIEFLEREIAYSFIWICCTTINLNFNNKFHANSITFLTFGYLASPTEEFKDSSLGRINIHIPLPVPVLNNYKQDGIEFIR